MTMTEKAKSVQSAKELPNLRRNPRTEARMPPDEQNLAFPIADGSGQIVNTDSKAPCEDQTSDCPIVETLPAQADKDMRPTVKRLWLELTNPDRPCDSVSVDYRVGRIRYLEKLMRTEFASTADLRQHVERYLSGHDGRRLPVPQAIKRARKKLKLSQNQLAELLSLKDHTLISKYESGKRVPTNRVLEWLRKTEIVTRKEPVKGNGQTPRFPVTSNGGNEASISSNMGESGTSPEQQDYTPDKDDFPASTQEVL